MQCLELPCTSGRLHGVPLAVHPLHHAACVLRAGARRARRAGLRGLLASSGAGKGGRGELLSRGAHALGQQPSHDSSDSDGGVKRLRQGGLDQQRQQQQQLQTQPEQQQQGGMSGKLVASATVVGGLALLAAGGFLLKDQINTFLEYFITLVDDYGPLGYLAYAAVYTALEVLAVPAIPLTMTAGVIFGVVPGTAVVSVAGTLACTISFLIARYVARDKIKDWEKVHPRWAAIDRAIGRDGFRVVMLLRLSPLLPLAASNYLYGLTSVDLGSYVLASWLGMLPGTFAYVSAGTYGKALLKASESLEGAGGAPMWQVGLGLGFTAFAVWYVGRLATRAIAGVDAELSQELTGSEDE